MAEKSKSKLFKRLKIWILLSASLLVVLLTTLITILTLKFKDNNRSSYISRNISYSEIVRQNYIKGFENTEDSGKFSYLLPNEDINELLLNGVKSLKDKHIKNVYFDTDSQGLRYFFVDLAKVGVKTRVVITTVPEVKDESTIALKIHSLSMGKVNALEILTKRGYISSAFIDPYFKECHLPISFDESNSSFLVKPYEWIKSFPHSDIGEYIFNSSKDISNAYSFNQSLFGFDLDISKLKSNHEYIDVDTSFVPNIYEEVKNGCVNEYPSMLEGETNTIYSLSVDTLNKHIKSSFVSDIKEEVTSTYIDKKVVFDLKGCNIHLDHIDKLTFTLIFEVNGYILPIDTYMTYNVSSEVYFGSYFEKESNMNPLINEALTNVLSKLSDSYSYFEYTSQGMLHLNLEALNSDPDIDIGIKLSKKIIDITPGSKSIEFRLTK